MRIARFSIHNFRGIRQAEIVLPAHAVLIGANNVGKTAVVEAITLVFGRGNLLRSLSDYDYFGGNPDASSRIHLRAILTDLPAEDPEQLPDLFNLKRGVPIWWNQAASRIEVGPGDGCSLAVEIGASARFDEDSLETDVVRYFVDDDGDPFIDETPRRVPEELRQSLGVFLLPASRTWDQILTFNSPLFRKLVQYSNAVPAKSILGLRDSLRAPSHRIEDEQPLGELVTRINTELAGFIGEDEADLRFKPTSGDIPSIMEALAAFLRGKTGDHLPMSASGSGIRSLQTMLVLLEFGRARAARNENFVLVAEEPELHLHPGHHRRLVARMRGVSHQTIVTTHSPQIAAYHQPSEIIVLQGNDGGITARPLFPYGEPIPERNALLRLYTVYRAEICEALMNRVALLPEGLTEYMWLRSLAKESMVAEGWSPSAGLSAATSVGVLPTQAAEITGTYRQFERVVSSVLPLVDGDQQGREYVKALKSEDAPPRDILCLEDGACLEHLLATFLCGESASAPPEVAEILDAAQLTRDELAQTLADPHHKTRWDIHEHVAAAVARDGTAAARVREFFEAVHTIGGSGSSSSPRATLDEARSSSATKVWTWRLHD